MPGLNTFQPSVSKSPDGRLWFVNDAVLQMINPDRVRKNGITPPVYVEDVRADRNSYPICGVIRLPPHSRDIEIGYTALSFSIPEKIRFRYKLDGRDQKWQDAGTRYAGSAGCDLGLDGSPLARASPHLPPAAHGEPAGPKPLEKVLHSRYEATEGAKQKAADKTAEYEAALRAARGEVYQSQEKLHRKLRPVRCGTGQRWVRFITVIARDFRAAYCNPACLAA
jgi:hypothetical protein